MYSSQKEGEKLRQELDAPNLEKGEMNKTLYANKTKQKAKHRAKISYQSNGKKRHSNTQREPRKQMLTKIRPTNGSEALDLKKISKKRILRTLLCLSR